MATDFIHTQQSFWAQYTGQEISEEKAKEISSNLLAFTGQILKMRSILEERENNYDRKK